MTPTPKAEPRAGTQSVSGCSATPQSGAMSDDDLQRAAFDIAYRCANAKPLLNNATRVHPFDEEIADLARCYAAAAALQEQSTQRPAVPEQIECALVVCRNDCEAVEEYAFQHSEHPAETLRAHIAAMASNYERSLQDIKNCVGTINALVDEKRDNLAEIERLRGALLALTSACLTPVAKLPEPDIVFEKAVFAAQAALAPSPAEVKS